jgi:hypothetical protein
MFKGIKFLDSYQKDDIDIFFGRDIEASELFDKICKSRINLLYGLSGTGKTSLVSCGLANKFSTSEWLEIMIRRGSDTNILHATRQAIQDNAITPLSSQDTLKDALNILYLDHFKPIYLIFDQFEELFIYGHQGTLLESGENDNTTREVVQFIKFIKEILVLSDENFKIEVVPRAEMPQAPPITLIIIIREEFFTYLDEFEREIPRFYDSRYRLERMRAATLESVILNIAKQSGIELSPSNAKKIIENIRDSQSKVVDLPYLQVYLEKLFSNSDQDHKTITEKNIDNLGKLGDVLGLFLEEQVAKIAQETNCHSDEIWDILKLFISTENTKQGLSFHTIEKSNTDEQKIKLDIESSPKL